MKKVSLIVIGLLSLLTVGYAYIDKDLVESTNNKIYYEKIEEQYNNKSINEEQENYEEDKESEVVSEKDYEVTLNAPGDTYSYKAVITNSTNHDAVIDSLTLGNLTESQERYLDYTVTYEDETPIKVGDIIEKNSKKTVVITVTFKTDITKEDLPQTNEEVDLTLSINFNYQ